MRCPNCGNEVSENTILCPFCTYNVKADNQKVSLINSDEFKGTIKKGVFFLRVIIALPFLFIGLLFFTPAFISSCKSLYYEKTTATLVDYETTSIGVCGVYDYEVDGKTYTMNATVCKESVSDLNQNYIVSYDKNNPNKVVEGLQIQTPFIFTGLFMIFIAFVIVFGKNISTLIVKRVQKNINH